MDFDMKSTSVRMNLRHFKLYVVSGDSLHPLIFNAAIMLSESS